MIIIFIKDFKAVCRFGLRRRLRGEEPCVTLRYRHHNASFRCRPGVRLWSVPRLVGYGAAAQDNPARVAYGGGCPGRRDLLMFAASVPLLLSFPTIAMLNSPRAHATSNIAGRIVFFDPGHNGANDSSINRQVVNGPGGTKECPTTGTVTDAGYPEHSFNWTPRCVLSRPGVRTALSRGNANAWGPVSISGPRWPMLCGLMPSSASTLMAVHPTDEALR